MSEYIKIVLLLALIALAIVVHNFLMLAAMYAFLGISAAALNAVLEELNSLQPQD